MVMQHFRRYMPPILLGTIIGHLIADLLVLSISLSVVVDYRLVNLFFSLPESLIAGVLLTLIAALLLPKVRKWTLVAITFVSSLLGLLFGLLLADSFSFDMQPLGASVPSSTDSQWKVIPWISSQYTLYAVLSYLLCTLIAGGILMGAIAYFRRTRRTLRST